MESIGEQRPRHQLDLRVGGVARGLGDKIVAIVSRTTPGPLECWAGRMPYAHSNRNFTVVALASSLPPG